MRITLILLALLLSSCTRYQMTTTQVLDDLGVKYEMVDEINSNEKAEAIYVFKEDTIYFKTYSKYLMWHELTHKLRRDAGLFGDHYLEEVIAVKASYRLGKVSNIGSGIMKWEIPAVISKTVRANGFTPRKLSEDELQYVDEQVTATENLLRDRLKSRGHTLDEIDWVKTAILILIQNEGYKHDEKEMLA